MYMSFITAYMHELEENGFTTYFALPVVTFTYMNETFKDEIGMVRLISMDFI